MFIRRKRVILTIIDLLSTEMDFTHLQSRRQLRCEMPAVAAASRASDWERKAMVKRKAVGSNPQ